MVSKKQSLEIKQEQRLFFTPKMQQAIAIMQAPIMELESLIQNELNNNPLLDTEICDATDSDIDDATQSELLPNELPKDDDDFSVISEMEFDFKEIFSDANGSTPNFDQENKLEKCYATSANLYDALFQQAREQFLGNSALQMATSIIGSLDSNGFLTSSLEEIALMENYDKIELNKILDVIQTFEPHGIAAKNLQESLLIQLRHLNKNESLAYNIVENHYLDLIHNRISAIEKKIDTERKVILKALYEDLAHLNFSPATSFTKTVSPQIIPDLTIEKRDEKWHVTVHHVKIPNIEFNKTYIKCLQENDNKENIQYLNKHYHSAKWLMKNIMERNHTLLGIAEFILKEQRSFFQSATGQLKPLQLKDAALALSLHQSTITRAIANKYAFTPRGLILLRDFFSNAIEKDDGIEIAPKTVQNEIQNLITQENKAKPLSDAELSKQLKEIGIPCARRTVTKYRKVLRIGNTRERRQFC